MRKKSILTNNFLLSPPIDDIYSKGNYFSIHFKKMNKDGYIKLCIM